MSGKYYLTTPLYYVNSRPHIGHSYTNIAADVLARYQRLMGKEVLFLTGTDEHGQKIARAAATAGMEPGPFVDQISQTFRELWSTLNISYDDFIRTTEPRHKEAVKQVWLTLQAKGELYTASYEGYYCTSCETFLTEEIVRQMVSENKPIICPDCSRPAEKLQETNYFFKMSKYQDWLIAAIEKGADEKGRPFVVLPVSRRNEVLGFLKNNKLEDLCVSRPKNRLTWGIESPLSPDHVTYVWFDALVNYISACGYPKPMKMWPAEVHLIGKDILRHHAIYWPVILHALGLELPKLIFAHGWWVQGGEKMSKSKGNVVDPIEVVKTYGVDAYRFFLLREAPFGEDGTFSDEAITKRYNTDLANDLGNLVSRTFTMWDKYFTGEKISLKNDSAKLLKSMAPLMEKLDFAAALALIWDEIGKANKLIEVKAPWTLAKENKTEELREVLLSLFETLKAVSKAIDPFMPETAKAIEACFEKGGKPSPLFPRIDTKKG